jgi:Xaa-Pro dipeptidase
MRQLRVERLQAKLKESGIDCAVLVPGPNLFYLTGLSMHLSERITVALIPADGPARMVLPMLEKPQAEGKIEIDAEFFPWQDGEGPDSAFKNAVDSLSLDGKTLGVEFQNMRVLEQSQIRKHAPNAKFSKLEETLGLLRIIKDDEEISKMRRAVQLTEEVLEAMIRQMHEGMTEAECALIYQLEALNAGCGGLSFTPIVASGPNGGSPHVIPGDRKLQRGDMVTIDAGVFYQSYPGDITRNLAVGELDAELEKIHQIVEESNAAGRLAAKPGIACQEVDRAARKVIDDAGYGEYFIHRTGHGLGLEVHEPPYMTEGNEQILEPGMTFTVEPGIYVPEIGGARVEDDMLITKDGAESLTQSPRSLRRI